MSPPDTNLEKQEKRHKGPLVGIGGALAVAVLAFLGVLVWMDYFDPPADEPVGDGASEPAATTTE
ncbi:hypothetical protein D6850_08890 [Roseovarius spongiae]|uniref:Uncharacterized protein n=1 Tax=Roseovarius spongiae TaxID=2320272 RepID=A0A3A8AV54_9RHOB|nr:hypothetical protein [Roseovarius spongiae]RKF14968.1 hypothetical protein D6850_08890 [Roseovarius spongiae]